MDTEWTVSLFQNQLTNTQIMKISRTTQFTGLALLILFQLGCQKSEPQIDIEAEKQAISELTDRWVEAERQRDLDGTLAVISDDAVWLPAGGEVAEWGLVVTGSWIKVASCFLPQDWPGQ